jgi:small subunit ribosomal protein S7
VARRRSAAKRTVLPDPVFHSVLATKFVNKIMQRGKKILASGIFYDAIDLLKGDKERVDGFKLFEQAVENCKPQVEVKSRRVGGANYQVPVEVRGSRKLTLSIRWIIEFAGLRKEKTFAERLAMELGEAAKGTGASIKKRDDVHKMAEANRAFSHFKW